MLSDLISFSFQSSVSLFTGLQFVVCIKFVRPSRTISEPWIVCNYKIGNNLDSHGKSLPSCTTITPDFKINNFKIDKVFHSQSSTFPQNMFCFLPIEDSSSLSSLTGASLLGTQNFIPYCKCCFRHYWFQRMERSRTFYNLPYYRKLIMHTSNHEDWLHIGCFVHSSDAPFQGQILDESATAPNVCAISTRTIDLSHF